MAWSWESCGRVSGTPGHPKSPQHDEALADTPQGKHAAPAGELSTVTYCTLPAFTCSHKAHMLTQGKIHTARITDIATGHWAGGSCMVLM